jgi:hypothetical protein
MPICWWSIPSNCPHHQHWWIDGNGVQVQHHVPWSESWIATNQHRKCCCSQMHPRMSQRCWKNIQQSPTDLVKEYRPWGKQNDEQEPPSLQRATPPSLPQPNDSCIPV